MTPLEGPEFQISPNVRVAVVGYVKPKELRMSPRAVDFTNPRRTESPTREVYIPSTQDDPIEVLSVIVGFAPG